MLMRSIGVGLMILAVASGLGAQQIDYGAVWENATPFDRFLSSVRSQEAQWKSRFANAAIDADALTRTRALKERRRLLVIAEDRCHDSAWAVPYIAKLAAAVPERLELRVISRDAARDVPKEYRTPNGGLATPTVIVLDESNNPLGGWVERPSALRIWVAANKPALSSEELRAKIQSWYAGDAGQSTVREIVELLEQRQAEGK